MKENRLSIQIKRPLAEVFEFSTNPKNTHLWFTSISEEKTNEWPIKKGTIYKSRQGDGDWNGYLVTDFELNKFFELSSVHDVYKVRYEYKQLGEYLTEMAYTESVNEGELSNLTSQDVLIKLKNILEK